jgi:O-antigen ligase
MLAWGGAVTRGLEHPWIGHGPGWDFTKTLTLELWPHNAYLYYFNITGLFGLSAFIFLLVKLVQASWPGIRSSIVRSSFPEALMKALHVSLVIFIIDQIKIDYLRNDIYMYFVWFFFGLIAATRNVIRSDAAAARAEK